jgi:ribose transport system substrate-binding protein
MIDAVFAINDPAAIGWVQIGYDVMNGKKPPEELTLIPVDLITKDNVDQYKGWTK